MASVSDSTHMEAVISLFLDVLVRIWTDQLYLYKRLKNTLVHSAQSRKKFLSF